MDEKWFWTGTILIAIGLIAFACLKVFDMFATAVIMAAMSAYIVYPLARRINQVCSGARYKWARGYSFAAAASFLLLVVPIVILVFQTISTLTATRWSKVFLDFLYYSPTLAAKVKGVLDSIGMEAFSELVSVRINQMLLTLNTKVGSSVERIASAAILQVPIYLVSTFYFLKDGPRLVAKIRAFVPRNRRFLRELIEHMDRVAHGLFMGHFITSIVVGIIAAIGFWILDAIGVIAIGGWTYAVFLGVITAVFVLLPIIGAFAVYIPMSIWVLMSQPMPRGALNAAIVFIFGIVFLTAIPDFNIRPILVGRKGGIHPLLVLLGFVGGPFIWGVKGFVLGPLALGLAQAALESYFEYQEVKRHGGRD